MITVEKLRIYEEFNGDVDGWVRTSMDKGGLVTTDADWHLIDELLTGLTIVEAGLASPTFSREVETRVLATTADDATRVALRTLVARHVRPGRQRG